MPEKNDRISPLLKWVGGKTQLLDDISSKFPLKFNNYFEPFLGGGAVFFSLARSGSTISDVNPRLVNFYQQVSQNPESLSAEVELIRKGFEGQRSFKESYLDYRKEMNELHPDNVRAAALFLSINKTAFNGLYRENKGGSFNVPFNNFKTIPKMIDVENLSKASALLKNTRILNVGFVDGTQDAKADDLVYFDPPYVPLRPTSNFTSYSSGEFGEREQLLLIKTAVELRSKGVLVMLSNSYSPWVVDAYSAEGFKIHEVSAKRNVAASAASRAKVSEALIVGY